MLKFGWFRSTDVPWDQGEGGAESVFKLDANGLGLPSKDVGAPSSCQGELFAGVLSAWLTRGNSLEGKGGAGGAGGGDGAKAAAGEAGAPNAPGGAIVVDSPISSSSSEEVC